MKRLIVRCLIAGVFATGFGGIGFASPEFVADNGLDFWNLPKLHNEIDLCRKKSEELEQLTRNTMTRMNAKLAIVDEVYDGSITFREAAQRFRNLNAGNPKFTEQAQLHRPNSSDEECQYWNVIDCARNTIGRYNHRDQFVSRLTDELRYLTAHGECKLQN